MEPCLECQIVKKELPSYALLDFHKVYVCLDRNQNILGRVLVMTKKCYKYSYSIPNEERILNYDWATTLVERALVHSLGADWPQVYQLEGNHTHAHRKVIPRRFDDGLPLMVRFSELPEVILLDDRMMNIADTLVAGIRKEYIDFPNTFVDMRKL